MADLSTTYMGVKLKNPLILGASNLVTKPDVIKQIEDAGIGAIVYRSLFEEQIQLENLQMEQPENEFVIRALNANHRLKFISNQLSALSQLKQVIAETKPDVFDLNQLLSELAQGYCSQANNISFQGANRPVMI
ncbi:MAG: hypothetical protein L3J54_02545, partial [Draconibacterium sp.]|nr:hypothetical protein [Draconibacterium sp.]